MHQPAQFQEPAPTQQSPPTSRLLSLPAHLRARIFSHAFSIHTIYVNINPWSSHPSRSRPPYPSFCYFNALTHSAESLSILLASTLVSAQFHSETHMLPFTLNTFEVYFADIENFVDTIPTSMASCIHTLKVEMYQLWCLRAYEGDLHWLEKVPGLKKVVVMKGRKRCFAGLERVVKRAISVYAQMEVEVVGGEIEGDEVDRVVGRRRLGC
jgi:hypothetical protein